MILDQNITHDSGVDLCCYLLVISQFTCTDPMACFIFLVLWRFVCLVLNATEMLAKHIFTHFIPEPLLEMSMITPCRNYHFVSFATFVIRANYL